MDLGLKGKVALVAAASKGLGRASAHALAAEGATVIICGRNERDVQDTAREITAATGSMVVPVKADVANPADIKRFVDTARDQFGTVHVLVNNAGGPPVGSILELSDDAWEKGFQLTMMSMVRMTREVLPMMARQRWGRIITITSFVAKQPINELILSASVRPGIHALSKILANVHAKDNITINAVCPGNILTKRQEDLNRARAEEKKMKLEEYLLEAAKQIPAGRMGKPGEIGNVVAFLASEQAAYINGVTLLVDGGLTKGVN
ncbi:MAG: SDR family oxidoreductase [Bacteroidota bacterium]